VTDDNLPSPAAGLGPRSRNRRLLFRAPNAGQSVLILVAESLILAAAFGWPTGTGVPFLTGWIALFLLPMLIAAGVTGPIASALGGRLSLRRSLLLAVTAGALPIPIALVWRGVDAFDPSVLPPLAAVLLFLEGPVLWFREMSLFGVSNPSHLRSLPAAAFAPSLASALVFLFYAPTAALVVEGFLFLAIGFLACALLLRAADRPLRREFGVSGVSLIRPMLDHINGRDPAATEAIERFFAKFSAPADLDLVLVAFGLGKTTKATIALPTVHPGPFGALGASDLPRRLAERLGPSAGVVLVPHTPCNHDQDLPTSQEFERLASETRALWTQVTSGEYHPGPTNASPLVAPYPASFARVQLLGSTAIAVVTQAPAPTDDIALSVVAPVVRKLEAAGGPRLALIDGHNSYVEDQGDISFGTPTASKLAADLEQALERARSTARPGPVRAGVAIREGYSLGGDGIGPHGIRVLAIEAAGTRTAYVLIDGNNLMPGLRGAILESLAPLVGAAEVMTTDNHIVHEVDGGTNPVGERYPAERLVADVRATTEAALADLAEVEVRSGWRSLPGIPVLQPGWTARLLTSLGDTLSMFTNALLMTFLLVLTGSLVVLLAFR
jgi:putative membrane protein